ncbi:MAG: ATP-binding protein [Thermoanaerobaculia bacterium]
MSGPSSASSPPSGETRLLLARRALAPSKVRFWGLLVPIHLAAFAALYFGTFALLERAYRQAASTAARFQLDEAVRDMPLLSAAEMAATGARNPHTFAGTLAANHPIGLRLYRRDGTPLGSTNLSVDRAEQERVRAFLADPAARAETWIETDAQSRQWVRGLVRLNAEVSCARCHEAGSTRGAAAMRIDFTEPLREIHTAMRWRIGWLLGAWVTLIAAVTIFVQWTVRRSAARLGEELRATAEGGTADLGSRSSLPLDPVAAEVHRGLRELLSRQRQREADVAVRLARVDQLASLGQLAAGLAHEIKNPLAGIQGALEVLRDDSDDGETVRIYEEMLAELKRVNVILYRLLEAGRPAPLRLARTDLGKLLDETSELLRPSLRRQKVDLVTEAAAGLPGLQIDPAKIRQVLVNLIQNAAEAISSTPEQGGRIAIRASGFPAEAAVVVAVEDNGPGIPPEQLATVFEPFFTTKFTGTGLGLAISKSLVEQHGGRIEVTSEVGKGTSFLIILPERREAADREAPDSDTPPAGEKKES